MKSNRNPHHVVVGNIPPANSLASRLLTARQASLALRLYIAETFSSLPPAGYEYQSRTYYTSEQLFEWLALLAAKQVRALRFDLVNDRSAHLNPLSDDHADDEEDDVDGEDDDEDDV